MTTEEQRIKIATACGWLDIERCSRKTLLSHPEGGEWKGTKDPPSINYERTFEILPRYPTDLNACHEMEKIIDNSQKTDYIRLLNKGDFSYRRLAFATGPQRCEAFLKTLGLWENEQ